MTRYKGLKTLEILQSAKNYNYWIAQNFIPYLRSPMLEIGSGIGNISRYFIEKDKIFLTDNDRYLVNRLKKKFPNHANYIFQLDIMRNIPEKYKKHFATLAIINVLEHIEDDIRALQNMHKLLKRNGRILLLVPANQFAFTALDRNLGHLRRYEKNDLRNKLEICGFNIEKMFFFNFIGLFSWIMRSFLEKTNTLNPHHVEIFDRIVPLLKIIESLKHPPLGISLIAIAKKL